MLSGRQLAERKVILIRSGIELVESWLSDVLRLLRLPLAPSSLDVFTTPGAAPKTWARLLGCVLLSRTLISSLLSASLLAELHCLW